MNNDAMIALAKTLGIAADQLMQWFTAKVIAEAHADLAISILLVIVATVCATAARRTEDEDRSLIAAIACGVSLFFSSLFFYCFVIEIAAPQALAVEAILKAIKQ